MKVYKYTLSIPHRGFFTETIRHEEYYTKSKAIDVANTIRKNYRAIMSHGYIRESFFPCDMDAAPMIFISIVDLPEGVDKYEEYKGESFSPALIY